MTVQELDETFDSLLSDAKSIVQSIEDGSNVSIDGKHIPNSELAAKGAADLIAISSILKYFEGE